MSRFLLMIKKRNWDHVDFPWLAEGDLPADPIGDLKTSNNSLSVWHIEEDESNLEKVILGLIVNRMKIDKLEYGLFDRTIIEKLGIQTDNTPGKLPMSDVNKWHWDLINLSANSLVGFAKEIFQVIEKRLVLDDDARELVVNASRSSALNLESLNVKIRGEIQSLLE